MHNSKESIRPEIADERAEVLPLHGRAHRCNHHAAETFNINAIEILPIYCFPTQFFFSSDIILSNPPGTGGREYEGSHPG